MINRAHRFHGHNSLRFVYSHGQLVRGQLCALKYALNTRRTTYRAAVVVSRKVSKLAVVRNRIRRRIYEVIRLAEDSIKEPYDIVFTVYAEQVAEMDADELRQLVIGHMQRAQVVAPETKHGIVDNKEKLRA